MKMKRMDDGFVWKILTKEEARVLYGTMEVYKLYDDGSEGLVESEEEIESHGGQFGIEVGFAVEIIETV